MLRKSQDFILRPWGPRNPNLGHTVGRGNMRLPSCGYKLKSEMCVHFGTEVPNLAQIVPEVALLTKLPTSFCIHPDLKMKSWDVWGMAIIQQLGGSTVNTACCMLHTAYCMLHTAYCKQITYCKYYILQTIHGQQPDPWPSFRRVRAGR